MCLRGSPAPLYESQLRLLVTTQRFKTAAQTLVQRHQSVQPADSFAAVAARCSVLLDACGTT